ncbi:hypothetical protein T439DRAFT_327258 [Meredithblackwellia eburnea MCA 4105]
MSPALLEIGQTSIAQDRDDLPAAIKKYGSASSTTWIEERYSIWRSPLSTADRPRIQGYLHSGGFNFAWGNPICHPDDLKETAEEWVAWCKEHKNKFVFACIDGRLEAILAVGMCGLHWQTVSCLREDVLHPDHVDLEKKDVRKNRLKAEHAGVSVDELVVKGPTWLPPDDVKQKIEQGLQRWKDSRKGTQIASSSLLPWVDSRHRRYFIAKRGSDIVGLAILAPIHDHGYQIKNSISFPEAPRGTSEDLLGSVIEQMQAEHRDTLTFGTSASEDLELEHFSNGWKIKYLPKVYHHIIEKHHLAERGQFRDKFSLETENLYVSFPRHGFGWLGILGLMKMLRTQ